MAGLDELLYRPTFQGPSIDGTRDPHERDDAAAVKTYRYLRLGMVVIALALIASVLIQHRNAHCWQGSISAYYYTPARPIFVSGLFAIATLLVVIKGSTTVEDVLLDVAGMFAPIVAFVPTTFEPSCVPGHALATAHEKLPDNVLRDINNNISTLLWAGFAALGIAILVFVIERYSAHDDKVATRDVGPRLFQLAFTGLLLFVAWWLQASHRILDLHGKSAVLLFAALASASIMSGLSLFRINRDDGPKTSTRWKVFAISYIAVGLTMALAGFIITWLPGHWDHRTLVLEMTEIGLFVGMWIVQSVERWGKVLQRKP